MLIARMTLTPLAVEPDAPPRPIVIVNTRTEMPGQFRPMLDTV